MLTSQFNISLKPYLYAEDAFPDFVEHEDRTGGDISTVVGCISHLTASRYVVLSLESAVLLLCLEH